MYFFFVYLHVSQVIFIMLLTVLTNSITLDYFYTLAQQ